MDLLPFVKERLAEINTNMSTRTSWVEDMDKCSEELESEGDVEELRGEIQRAISFVVADINKEIHAV